MRIIYLFILLISITTCSNNKKTYWCGDHPCINKAERKSYFKENMIIEVKSIDKKDKKKLSNYEKLMKQAEINQKRKALKEKKLTKELKKEKKDKEKKAIKQSKLKKKKISKKQSKINKRKKLKKETKKIKKKDKNKKFAQIKKPEISKSIFDQLFNDIKGKNALKPYPDINNIPN